RRTRGDQARVPAPAYAAHVADERALRDRGGRRHRHRGGAAEHPRHRARNARGDRLHDQRRRRLPDHRPDAQDVQDSRAHEVMTPHLVEQFIQVAYIVAAALFILALTWLAAPATARRGVRAGEAGMLLAGVGTVLHQGIVTYRGQNVVNLSLLAAAVAIGIYLVVEPGASHLFPLFVALGLVFGVLLIIPIGGADMPTVISLLNSYAGLSAAAMGFVLENNLLIIAGALDGASGFILSVIMCKAMNRSFTNVLFGAFGQFQAAAEARGEARTVRSATAEEAASILEAASSVIVVPGYGMAVAQAQHKVRELYDALTKRGMSPGFAGIENELYYLGKTLMLFGDAKSFVGAIVKELSDGGHG